MRDVPAGIELRRAAPADIEAVMELVRAGIDQYREWAPEFTPPAATPEMRERLDLLYSDDERAWILLAHAGDELVGLASVSTTTAADPRDPGPDTIYLWQMFIRRDWQGRGLAGPMLDRLLAEARRRGKTRIVLWAAEGASQARRFYEREGFALTGERDDENSFGLPLVQYGREI
jgi:GNAT superfamily N-acetyltransferase